jgi:hypothetical protein
MQISKNHTNRFINQGTKESQAYPISALLGLPPVQSYSREKQSLSSDPSDLANVNYKSYLPHLTALHHSEA